MTLLIGLSFEEDVLDLCLSICRGTEVEKEIVKATHEERVNFLLENGFEFD